MRIILDTGVFFRPDALLGLGACDAIVPSVAYMERVRQLRRDGRTARELDDVLRMIGATVEPFGQVEALRLRPVDEARRRRLARDAMVACHVGKDDVLWTTNTSDFLELGLSPEQIVALP
jgi:hypothetical protein